VRPKESYFNKIIIVQSLKEFKTGDRLQDDLNMLVLQTEGLVTSELKNVRNRDDIIGLLIEIEEDVKVGKYSPVIHFEMHGSNDRSGLLLGTSEHISWRELRDLLARINVQCCSNLIVCLSACYGGWFASSVELDSRAPCWALVGPKDVMQPDDLLSDYTRFYVELLKSKNGITAIKVLNNDKSNDEAPYFFITAEMFFKIAWENYLKMGATNKQLNIRANQLLRKLRKDKRVDKNKLPSRNDVKQSFIDHHPVLFKKSKEHFFMLDMYPKNKERFTVEYEELKKI
jgi:hypothetical protein